jgi:hypothetical protein
MRLRKGKGVGCRRTANPLCGRVHDDVSAVVDGTNEEAACAKRVVDDDGDTGFVGDGDDLFKVWDVVFGVADALDLLFVSCHVPFTAHPVSRPLSLSKGIDKTVQLKPLSSNRIRSKK